MQHLHIVALLRFRENHLEEAKKLLTQLVTETRKEPGCLQYDLIEDREKKATFFIVERWESHDHHAEHGNAPHLSFFRTQSMPMIKESTEVYHGYKMF
ncbi:MULTISPECIES: putative quinol monooxygenase [Amniculibacterium]|uniref:putative quinol monooxygenase n=1 Tax=Amniculibacterium TaxID=2715289 RepID=UPI000F59F6AE|nr:MULTISPECIES: putative quinol monooxygenase [Amniculibacterium]